MLWYTFLPQLRTYVHNFAWVSYIHRYSLRAIHIIETDTLGQVTHHNLWTYRESSCPPPQSSHNGRRTSPWSPRRLLHLSHQHVHRVDDPRNVPQYGEQEVDPELHLHHPSRIRRRESTTHHQLMWCPWGVELSSTYAAAVAQEDADRREEDGEEHLQERRRRHCLCLARRVTMRLLSVSGGTRKKKNRLERNCVPDERWHAARAQFIVSVLLGEVGGRFHFRKEWQLLWS